MKSELGPKYGFHLTVLLGQVYVGKGAILVDKSLARVTEDWALAVDWVGYGVPTGLWRKLL